VSEPTGQPPVPPPEDDPEMLRGGRLDHATGNAYERWIDKGSAEDEDEATQEAARVAGEMALEADDECRKIEAEVANIEAQAPGSIAAQEAEAIKARVEQDADQAVNASLDSDAAATDAQQRDTRRHPDPATAKADYQRATADVGVATKDLVDEESLEKQLDAAAKGTLPPPPPDPPPIEPK